MYLGIGLGITRLSGVLGFNPASLFANGEEGAWYDPSDLTILYQNGSTPVTGTGQPVGLMLDKSKGLVLGPELVDIANTAAAWVPYGSNTIAQDGDAVKVTYVDNTFGAYTLLASFGVSALSQNLTTGVTYKVSCQIRVDSGTARIGLGGPNDIPNSIIITSSTSFVDIVLHARSTSNYVNLILNTDAGTVAYIRNISVKELPGNHATQTTSAARPVLQQSGGLYYLDFDGVDDSMAVTFASAQAQPNSIGVGFKFDDYTSNQYDFVFDSPKPLSPYVDRHALFDNNGELRFSAGSSLLTSLSTINSTVFAGIYNTTSSSGRINGTEVITGDVGAWVWAGVVLGAAFLNHFNMDGRIYSFVGINRTLDPDEITDLETYLAAKSGVTI